ncbi:MAG: hypothetical protein HQ595_02450 [Candidatus Omnitrophica bacterium]|nr:hypothetical protein [Candidatus Omnitrophota bacterium]
MLKVRSAVCLCLIGVSFFLLPDLACAVKMNVDPPRVEITMEPGQEQGGYITISNHDADRPIHVRAYVSDLVYLPDGSNDFLASGTTPWGITDWVKIGPTEFDVAPGRDRQVRYIVEIPRGARGGKYGVVFFEISPTLREIQDKTGAAVNLRIGSIFLLVAKGTEIQSAELIDLKVGQPDADGNFEVSCNIRNDSNVLIRPFGTVKILSDVDTELAQVIVNPEKSGVLPGTSRQISVKYDKAKLAPGRYAALAVLDYGGEILLGGQTLFTISR